MSKGQIGKIYTTVDVWDRGEYIENLTGTTEEPYNDDPTLFDIVQEV